MANKITLTSSKYQGRYMELVCVQEQDIANNKSVITWTLSTIGGSSSYYATGPTTVTINGEQVYYKARTGGSGSGFPAYKGSVSGTITVPHNADGSKTIAVSFKTVIYYGASDATTYSDSWELDKIPRAAEIDSVSEFTDENTPIIKYTNYVGSAATLIEAYIYADDGTTLLVDGKSVSITAGSVEYALTEAERNTLRKAAKSTNSLPVKFKMRTMVSGVAYWSKPYAASMSVVNANPTATIQYRDNNETANKVTGNNQIFMAGVSEFKYTITATPQKGAEITSYKVWLGSKWAEEQSGQINDIDGDAFTYAVIDSRGNEFRDTVNISVVPYISVSCHQEANIDFYGETGAKITLNISGNFYNGAIGKTQNVIYLYYRIAEGSGEFGDLIPIYTERQIDGNAFSCVHEVTEGLNYEKSYTIEVVAQDEYKGVSGGTKTLRLVPVFDWSENDFNFNVPLKYKNNEMPFITEAKTKNGWTYRKWSNGVGECWKTLSHSTAINTEWGALYCGNATSRQDYPFEFESRPVENVTLQAGSYQGWLYAEKDGEGENSGVSSACYNICRPSAVASSKFYISFYVIGKYK